MARRSVLILLLLSGLLLPCAALHGEQFRGKFVGYVPEHERDYQHSLVPEPVQEFEEAPLTFHESETVDDWMADDDCADVCDTTDCCFTLWGRAEYLLYWTKGTHAPALATTSTAGTARAQAGVLGRAGTRVLFGDDELNNDARSGGRFTLGLWLDPCQSHSFDVTYFLLEDEGSAFSASNSNFSILARPFFNTLTSAQDSRLIAFPSVTSGTLDVRTNTQLHGLEAVFRYNTTACCMRTDLIVGYRFVELKDRVRIDELTTSLSGPTIGATIDLFDQFDTRNTFHGGQFGLSTHWESMPCWTWEGLAKVAIGHSSRRADMTAETITSFAGATAVTQSGLLIQPSNLGSFQDSGIGAIWEIGLTLRRDFNCGWSATAGYSGLLWNEVWRAGEQIDTNVNTSQIPPGILNGAARPSFPSNLESFWAQGVHFGIERCY